MPECSMKEVVFVPVSDDTLFEHPERISSPLIPYVPGMTILPQRTRQPMVRPKVCVARVARREETVE
jgi:hypothetical protein